MRHSVIRLVMGLLWIVIAVLDVVRGDYPFAALFALIGAAFLWSGYTMWKKEK